MAYDISMASFRIHLRQSVSNNGWNDKKIYDKEPFLRNQRELNESRHHISRIIYISIFLSNRQRELKCFGKKSCTYLTHSYDISIVHSYSSSMCIVYSNRSFPLTQRMLLAYTLTCCFHSQDIHISIHCTQLMDYFHIHSLHIISI